MARLKHYKKKMRPGYNTYCSPEQVLVDAQELEELKRTVSSSQSHTDRALTLAEKLATQYEELVKENKILKEENDRLNKFERNDILDLESS